jgi:type IV pilus assembly protein PilN
MPHINLLPWRETLKREREIRFGVITGIALAISGLVILGVHAYMQGRINYQEARNVLLDKEIKRLDKEIAQIQELEQRREKMIQRMEVIQQLEASRNKPVHLLSEIVERVPEGVYFTLLEQRDNTIMIEGIAQSDARVASLMRDLDGSPWLMQPSPTIIKEENRRGNNTNRSGRELKTFGLKIKLDDPRKKEEEEAEGGL